MLRLQGLKVFINQRLSAAVEEVIVHVERTLAEYEVELENRCRKLADGDPQSEEQRCSAVQQQLLIKEEDPEGQEWIPVLDKEDPDDPHTQEEKQGSWMSKKVMNHLQEPHGQDTSLSPFGCVHVKRESADNEDITCTEEKRKEGPPASSSAEQVKTEANGGDCEKEEPHHIIVSWVSGSDDKLPHWSEAETKDSSDDQRETRKPQADFNAMKNRAAKNDMRCATTNKTFTCSKCGKRFGQKHHLLTHMRCHTGEKPFCCSLCGKTFTQKGNLTKHQTIHTRENPCSCPVCGERFAQKGNLTQHLTVHMREKLCW